MGGSRPKDFFEPSVRSRGTNDPGLSYRSAMANTARGHIEQLPSGSFRVHVYAGTDPVTGRQRRLRETCPDDATAGRLPPHECILAATTHRRPTWLGPSARHHWLEAAWPAAVTGMAASPRPSGRRPYGGAAAPRRWPAPHRGRVPAVPPVATPARAGGRPPRAGHPVTVQRSQARSYVLALTRCGRSTLLVIFHGTTSAPIKGDGAVSRPVLSSPVPALAGRGLPCVLVTPCGRYRPPRRRLP